MGRAVAAGLVVSWSATAPADTFRGTRSDKLVERSHRISLTIEPGHADLVVRRTVHNGAARHDQARFWISVPDGAVATRLRTLGLLDEQPHWFEGELMEAGKAADLYRELTGISGYRWVKDPALLSWSSQRELRLQVFPIAPGAPKTIEYTLRMPTEYREGRYHVHLPAMGTTEQPAEVVVKPARRGGRLFVGDEPLDHGKRLRLDEVHGVDVSVSPHQAPTLGGALAVVPFARDRVLTRLRVEAAPRLGRVPRRARVVVVLDRSRSLDEPWHRAQVTAARAYLSHFAGRAGKVVVLSFDRRVRALHQRFVSVEQALADLAQLSPERHNGSQVDEALVEAERILAGEPAHLPKRILLLTDMKTRAAVTERSIRGALGTSGAVVHVGVVVDGEPSLQRADHYSWAEAVRVTGGVVWAATASVDASRAIDDDHRQVFDEWARPKRLHHFRVTASGVFPGYLGFDEELDEGQGVTAGWIDERSMPWLNVEGELWARPVRQVLRPDPAESKRWSALVFGSQLMHELSESEMMTLAMRGGAVSPVTSYLAIEPGVRPSTEGLDHGRYGRGEGIGLGRVGTIGHGAGSGQPGFDFQGYLSRHLAAAWRRCGGTGRAARIEVETTRAEVVDVRLVRVGEGEATGLRACMTEAAWNLVLPREFRSLESSGWGFVL